VEVGVTGVLDGATDVLVAVFTAMAVKVRLGVLVTDFEGLGLAVIVDVGVLLGRTNPVPVAEGVCDGAIVLAVAEVKDSGVAVHTSGSERGDGVRVGTFKAEIGVGGGNGLMNVYGFTNILIKIVASARPASITIEASMSQNDNLIASLPLLRYTVCIFQYNVV
jgi:hypothetical protein